MCPICRVNSFFITPSAHFPRTPEEKEEILKNYLSKMKQIPCKHYNNGRCPFGTSCFYSHGSGEGRYWGEENDDGGGRATHFDNADFGGLPRRFEKGRRRRKSMKIDMAPSNTREILVF